MSAAGASAVFPAFIKAEFEPGSAFAEFTSAAGAAGRNAGEQIQRGFRGSVAEIERMAQRALTMPRTNAGALDLGVDEMRRAAQAAELRAAALREVAAAASAVAAKEGQLTGAQQTHVAMANAAAAAAERDAQTKREQVVVYGQFQAQLNQTGSRLGTTSTATRILSASQDQATASAGRTRAAMANLSFQVQDVTQQLALGVNPFVVFAQQGGQIASALQQMYEGSARAKEGLSTVGTAATGASQGLGAANRATTNLEGKTVQLAAAEVTAVPAVNGLTAATVVQARAMGVAAASTNAAAAATVAQMTVGARLAAFFAGPWGSAVIAAVTVIGLFASRMGGATEAVEEAQTATDRFSQAQSTLGEMFDLTTGKLRDQSGALREHVELMRLNIRLAILNARAESVRQLQSSREAFAQAGETSWLAYIARAASRRSSGPYDPIAGNAAEQRTLVQNLRAAQAQLEAATNDAQRRTAQRAIDRATDAAITATERANFGEGTPLDGRAFRQAIIDEMSGRANAQIAELMSRTLAEGEVPRELRNQSRTARRERPDRRPEQANRALEEVTQINEAWDAQPAIVDRAEQAVRKLTDIIERAGEQKQPQSVIARLTAGANEANQSIREGLIREITQGFSEAPKLVQRATAAIDELNAAAEKLPDLRPQIAEAGEKIISALVRPYREFLADQVRSYDMQRLIAQGREEEAEALVTIHRLEEQLGPLGEDRRRVILESVIALREQARELERVRQQQQMYVTASNAVRGAITDAVADPRQMLSSISSIGQAYNRLRAEFTVDRLFGGLFRQIEDRITGRDQVLRANEEIAVSIASARAEVQSLTTAERNHRDSIEGVTSAVQRFKAALDIATQTVNGNATASSAVPAPASLSAGRQDGGAFDLSAGGPAARAAANSIASAVETAMAPFARVSSGFGRRIHPIRGTPDFHGGIDYPQPAGTAVPATLSGRVSFAGQRRDGYGNAVIIDHGDGLQSLYGHLSSISVSLGQMVQQGQRLGGVGTTGSSTGNHLHEEFRRNGQAVDPATIYGRAITVMTGATEQAASALTATAARVAGMIEPGNIANATGIATMSFGNELGEVLVPLFDDLGRRLTDEQAVDQYNRTGRHLGIFDTPEHATAYADALQRSDTAMVSATNGLGGLAEMLAGLKDSAGDAAQGVQDLITNAFDISQAANDNNNIGVDGPRRDPAASFNPRQWAQEIFGGAMAKLFGKQAGALMGDGIASAFEGAAIGSTMNSLMRSIGLKSSNTAAQIGGGIGNAIGFAIGGPMGAQIGAALGSITAGLAFGTTPRASSTIGIGAEGRLAVTGSTGSRRLQGQTVTAADSVLSTVERIAEALGGSVNAARGAVSIGVRDGNYRVDTTGKGVTKTKKGAIDFGEDAEAAVRAAVLDLIKDGVIEGLQQGAQTLLRAAKDIDSGIEKALKFEGVFADLKRHLDPVGAALDELDKRFLSLKRVFEEAGASVEDFAQLEQLYALERAEAIKQASEGMTSALKGLLDDLTVNNDALSLRDRLAQAHAKYDPLAARLAAGDKTVDYDAFAEAARLIESLTRQVSGSTSPYFAVLDEITRLTQSALSAQENIISIATANGGPFAGGTSGDTAPPVVSAIDRLGTHLGGILTDSIGGMLGAVNDNLATLVRQGNQAIGGSGSGSFPAFDNAHNF